MRIARRADRARRLPRAAAAKDRPTKHAGFTLLELIVVIAIFAVFSLMAYGGLDSVLKTRQQVELAQARLAQLQKAYLRLRNDLQQVRFRPARDGFGDLQPALRATDTAYLEFTRGGCRNPLNLPRPSLERVAYRYEDGELIRMSWRVLDQSQDSKPVELVLLDGLEDVRWQYLDSQREWQIRWPPDSPDQQPAETPPPLAVELTLRTKDIGELRYLFRLGSDAVKIPQAGAPSGTDPRTPPPASDSGDEPAP